MYKTISHNLYSGGLGLPPDRKLFKFTEGPYRQRLVALFQDSSGDIQLAYADPPYSSWSTPEQVASDAASLPFDAVFSPAGDLQLVYAERNTGYLLTRRLSFTDGSSTIGNAVYIYNGAETFAPSIALDKNGALWVSWSNHAGAAYDIRVKSSADSGASWGSGPTDPGETVATDVIGAVTRILTTVDRLYLVYSEYNTALYFLSRLLSGGSWSEPFVFASNVNVDSNFDAALSATGLLGIAFNAPSLYFREYDGANWSGLVPAAAESGRSPQLRYVNHVPVIIYLNSLSTDQQLVKFTHRQTGQFSTPEILEKRANLFHYCLLYHNLSASFHDRTLAASDSAAGDVFHPASNAMLASAGDALYLGLDERFRFVNFSLSSPGAGGTVTYSYWDGQAWQGFTPSDGAFPLDTPARDLRLWPDVCAVPLNWQKTLVNALSAYWIRIEVTSAFTSNPVGTRLTAVSELITLALAR